MSCVKLLNQPNRIVTNEGPSFKAELSPPIPVAMTIEPVQLPWIWIKLCIRAGTAAVPSLVMTPRAHSARGPNYADTADGFFPRRAFEHLCISYLPCPATHLSSAPIFTCCTRSDCFVAGVKLSGLARDRYDPKWQAPHAPSQASAGAKTYSKGSIQLSYCIRIASNSSVVFCRTYSHFPDLVLLSVCTACKKVNLALSV